MISVKDFSLRIGPRELVRPVSFQLGKGTKAGLVGRNGAGKTTTMRLLSGEPDRGAAEHGGVITCSGEVGYLPQDTTEGDLSEVAIDRIVSVRGIADLQRKIRKTEAQMAACEGEKLQKVMDRYARLDHEFTQAGGWAAQAEASQIAASLGLEQHTLKQELGTLSGGQRRRVELARVLFSGAQTLLLDEPTNHLDHDSILWLRDWIQAFTGGVLIISHDVELLRDTVNQVFYLDANRATLDIYNLGWDAYLQKREEDERRRRKERQNALRKAEALRAQGEKFRYKSTKAAAAQQMLKRAEELFKQAGENETREQVAKIRLPKPAACGRVPLSAKGLSKTFGSLEVFTGVDLAIDRGSRVAVLGLNGAGKTTLLKILAGLEEPDLGEVEAGHGLKLGYYAQEHETLRGDLTVSENLQLAAPALDETQARSLLGQFLFSGEDAFKPVSVLSGGEKTRLALAALVVSAANVLLLDEPTNNLDPASRAEILEALRNYEGAVILVSHDPGAVQALNPDRVLLLPDGDEDLWDESYLDLVTLT